MTITLISASFLGLLLVFVSIQVVRLRNKTRTSLGTGGHQALEVACRIQGNLSEYAPLGLILLGLLEYQGANYFLVTACGILLVVGRYIHAISLAKNNMALRVTGMLMTFASILICSVTGLLVAYKLI